MYRRILVGYQDTEQGRDALELGRILTRANGAEMHVVTASGEKGEDLAQLAISEGSDLVVLGSTHHGPLGRIVPVTTIGHLLADAPCAVAVAPPGFSKHSELDTEWKPLRGDLEDVGMRIVGVGYDGTPAGGNGGRNSAGPPTEVEALRQALPDAVAEPPETRALPVFMRALAARELIDGASQLSPQHLQRSAGGGILPCPYLPQRRQSAASSLMKTIRSEDSCHKSKSR